jgi:hypothetical protein
MKLERTITTIFMVPTLKIGREKLLENGFIDGYSKDGHREEQYNNAVYLVFRPKNIEKFKEFLDSEYERTKNLIDDYDYEDGLVVVVYELDAKWSDDFNLVKQGMYSKTSKEFQEVFPKVVKIMHNGLHRDEVSLQVRIFKKTKDMVDYWERELGVILDDDLEVWEGWSEERETLNVNKLIGKHVQ